jgi:hypothetical protein
MVVLVVAPLDLPLVLCEPWEVEEVEQVRSEELLTRLQLVAVELVVFPL